MYHVKLAIVSPQGEQCIIEHFRKGFRDQIQAEIVGIEIKMDDHVCIGREFEQDLRKELYLLQGAACR